VEKIAVVDYGMSNLHSVTSALNAVSNDRQIIEVCQRPEDIDNADRVVFPGQGAAADCMKQIQACALLPILKKAAQEKPFLGICMGMQVLLEHSEENGGTPCLGIVSGAVRRFDANMRIDGDRLKVPHMGGNQIQQSIDHPLWYGINQDSYFYFVHSYYVVPQRNEDIAGSTEYGDWFTSAVARDNIFATQFHPEKSAEYGLKLYQNFVSWQP